MRRVDLSHSCFLTRQRIRRRHRQYLLQVHLGHQGPHQGTCRRQCPQGMRNQVAQGQVLCILEFHHQHKRQLVHHRIHLHHCQGWLGQCLEHPLQCRAVHRCHHPSLRPRCQQLGHNHQATHQAFHRHQSLREQLVRMLPLQIERLNRFFRSQRRSPTRCRLCCHLLR